MPANTGKSPGGGHGNPLHYYCLGNPMDREAWWATVHRVTKESDMTECARAHTRTDCLTNLWHPSFYS